MPRDLEALVEMARRVRMSPEQEEAQRRSFAYGNAAFENPLITREMIDRHTQSLSEHGE